MGSVKIKTSLNWFFQPGKAQGQALLALKPHQTLTFKSKKDEATRDLK